MIQPIARCFTKCQNTAENAQQQQQRSTHKHNIAQCVDVFQNFCILIGDMYIFVFFWLRIRFPIFGQMKKEILVLLFPEARGAFCLNSWTLGRLSFFLLGILCCVIQKIHICFLFGLAPLGTLFPLLGRVCRLHLPNIGTMHRFRFLLFLRKNNSFIIGFFLRFCRATSLHSRRLYKGNRLARRFLLIHFCNCRIFRNFRAALFLLFKR